ncbi:MAG TPA: pantetheine-phosphate adenylyltransferase [Candidatus Dormibacteraeota bacterium]|nr:pantetheine-phosphate adenylyltransferase [Candidatus Dormibacteraeota bacterium]
MITALYPGSFDPLTHGHLDVVDRAAGIFDRVIIAVLENPSKRPLFSTEERVRMIRESLGQRSAVEVSTFDGLTIDCARRVGAKVIVRGLRAVSDFESEFQMALMNRRLEPEITTVFIPTSLRHLFLSSSLIKELAEFGGDIAEFVPPSVVEPLKQRLATREHRHEHP